MPATDCLKAAVLVLCAALIPALWPIAAAAQSPGLTRSQIARIDSVFAPYDAVDVPGCALALSRHDTLVFDITRADWERSRLGAP